ncbi:hypothetical protein [Streptomyces sp. NPDC008121]|uniref:hypothetical protein n=1 Tax=Streptomyces sp. NPDC008121 TaxID=3364809 RepID=UPI0036EF6C63
MVRRWFPPVTFALVASGLAVGGLWWWAVLRLLLVPQQTGLVEGAVAAGGWGLSLLPVHVAASTARGPRGRIRTGGSALSAGRTRLASGLFRFTAGRTRLTTASRPRRSGGGSDPS